MKGGHAESLNEKLVSLSIRSLKEGPLALSVLASLCGMGNLPMIFGGLAWRLASLPILENLGVLKGLYGMELLRSREALMIRLAERFSAMDVAFLMQMDAPKDLHAFNEHLKEHMNGNFPRFKGRIVRAGGERLITPVTDRALLDAQFQVLDSESMTQREVEQLLGAQIDKGISHDDVRIKSWLIPSKDDPTKVFLAQVSCHSIIDGISRMQTFALFQDEAEDRENNSVPYPKRKKHSAAEVFAIRDKFMQYDKRMEEMTASITNDGLGEAVGKIEIVTSQPLELTVIKARAKSLGVTMHQLFNGALYTTVSKLDIPEDQRPKLYKCLNAFTTHSSDEVVKLGSWRPTMQAGTIQSSFEPCTDLKANCLRSKEFWKLFKQNDELYVLLEFLGSAMCKTMPFPVVKKIIEKQYRNLSFCMSSMTGSLKKPWVFQGSQVDWVTSIGCHKNVGYPNISLVTLHDKVKISVSADVGTFPYAHELMEGVAHELTAPEETKN